LIIGGIHIFLPDSQVKASAHDKNETVGEGQPTVTIMMKEDVSESTQGQEEEEQKDEILTQWEIELRMLDDWLDNLEPEDGC
jgi:hypothetical protein